MSRTDTDDANDFDAKAVIMNTVLLCISIIAFFDISSPMKPNPHMI